MVGGTDFSLTAFRVSFYEQVSEVWSLKLEKLLDRRTLKLYRRHNDVGSFRLSFLHMNGSHYKYLHFLSNPLMNL